MSAIARDIGMNGIEGQKMLSGIGGSMTMVVTTTVKGAVTRSGTASPLIRSAAVTRTIIAMKTGNTEIRVHWRGRTRTPSRRLLTPKT